MLTKPSVGNVPTELRNFDDKQTKHRSKYEFCENERNC